MGWKDLLAKAEVITYPWTGGRELRTADRVFQVQGRLPPDHGWYNFEVGGNRSAKMTGPADPGDLVRVFAAAPGKAMCGYLAGDRFFEESGRFSPDPMKVPEQGETMHLIEDGLGLFSRVSGVRWPDGRLLFRGEEFSVGPEFDVQAAFEDGADSLTPIKGVTPALQVTFFFERWKQAERERRRREAEEAERKRLEEEARQQRLVAMQAMVQRAVGDGELRRELAKVDFEAAARAALRVTGAEYLSHTKLRGNEYAVRYRCEGRRLECVVNERLAVLDAGVCLTDHGDNDKKYDTYFTLESLPTVIREAIRKNRLVVWRHV